MEAHRQTQWTLRCCKTFHVRPTDSFAQWTLRCGQNIPCEAHRHWLCGPHMECFATPWGPLSLSVASHGMFLTKHSCEAHRQFCSVDSKVCEPHMECFATQTESQWPHMECCKTFHVRPTDRLSGLYMECCNTLSPFHVRPHRQFCSVDSESVCKTFHVRPTDRALWTLRCCKTFTWMFCNTDRLSGL